MWLQHLKIFIPSSTMRVRWPEVMPTPVSQRSATIQRCCRVEEPAAITTTLMYSQVEEAAAMATGRQMVRDPHLTTRITAIMPQTIDWPQLQNAVLVPVWLFSLLCLCRYSYSAAQAHYSTYIT